MLEAWGGTQPYLGTGEGNAGTHHGLVATLWPLSAVS
jgi:hypothetical protein